MEQFFDPELYVLRLNGSVQSKATLGKKRSVPLPASWSPTIRSKTHWTLAELLSIDTSDSPQLWDGFLPTEDIAIFAGVQGRGKSTLVRELCLAIARGDEYYLSRRLHTKHGKVIYVKGEGSIKGLARAFKRYEPNVASGELIVIDASQLSLSEVHEAVLKELMRGRADLVVFDSLGNFLEAEQNSNSDAQTFFKGCARYVEETCVLLIHHIVKAGYGEWPELKHLQGAGAFSQRPRAVIFMFGPESGNRRWLRMAKQNDVSDEFMQECLCLDYTGARYSSAGEKMKKVDIAPLMRTSTGNSRHCTPEEKKRARELREEGKSVGEIAQSLGRSKSTIQGVTKAKAVNNEIPISTPKRAQKAVVRSAQSLGKRMNERRKRDAPEIAE